MANEVYANGREIACKAAAGKSVAAFPDTCLSPPSPPAGPVPIPYPNTAYASDTTNGSTSVMISGQEVALKDQSTFKTSTGNEAATKSLGMGVVTHAIQGEASFIMWSMDVKIEGQNVDRHLDQMIHNEQCSPPNTGPWMYADASAFGDPGACAKEQSRINDACSDFEPNGLKNPCDAAKPPQKGAFDMRERLARKVADRIAADKCLSARRCALQPYEPNAADKKVGYSCCPPQTGHHLIEASALALTRGGTALQGVQNYSVAAAPCICAEGPSQHTGTHGLMHSFQSAFAATQPVQTLTAVDGTTTNFKATTYGAARDSSADCVTKVFPESGCDQNCLKAQMDAYHKSTCKMDDSTPIKAVEEGNIPLSDAQREIAARTMRVKLSKVLGESVFI